jgi:hypothetical protein
LSNSLRDEADRASVLLRVGDIVAWLPRHNVRTSLQNAQSMWQCCFAIAAHGIGRGCWRGPMALKTERVDLGAVTRRLVNLSRRCSLLCH